MTCFNWSNICCGDSEEEVKYSAFVNADDDDAWLTGANDAAATVPSTDKERIRRIEEKVTMANRHKQSQERRPGDRNTITCKPIDLTCLDQGPPSYPKSDDQVEFLSKVIQESLIVLDLEGAEIRLLCMAMQQETVAPGTTIIRKGDIGDFYYVVDQGTVVFVDPDRGDTILGSVGRGEGFGELALL